MEHHVVEAYERLKGVIADFAESAEHREDVVVYALNRLPPKYVVTDAGKAVTEAALDAPQHRTTIEVQVIEALRQVARVPRAQRTHSAGGG